ncbi:LysE family translocator [Magnetospirillum moscoviense]|nr:LysE family transporter [Magnetospirillum moscoviense]
MDDLFLFLRGIVIGFAVAAPIGPVGLMCIRKALGDGRAAAWAAGLGAALADTIFGGIVGLGLGAVSQFLDQFTNGLKLVGGLFMLALGVNAWRAAAHELDGVPGKGPGLVKDFLSTFAITMTNPGTILGVMGVFAAFGTDASPKGPVQAVVLIAGVGCGSALWWAVLTEMTIAARARFTPERMRLFNHISGAALMAFGAAALLSLVF